MIACVVGNILYKKGNMFDWEIQKFDIPSIIFYLVCETMQINSSLVAFSLISFIHFKIYFELVEYKQNKEKIKKKNIIPSSGQSETSSIYIQWKAYEK